MRETIIGITEFRAQAKKLLDHLHDQDVIVVRHSKPVGVLIHPDRLEQLRQRIDDLEDEVALFTTAGERGDTIPHEVAMKELRSEV